MFRATRLSMPYGATTPATAANVLQTYVSHLRKVLPSHRLVTLPPGYLLELEPDELDLQHFERLTREGRRRLAAGDGERALHNFDEALALWRGPPLGGVGAAPFAQVEIARLEELHLAAREQRFEAALTLGRHAEVVAELEALVREQPLGIAARAAHARALPRGRTTDALATYRQGRALLVEEVGIEPSQELKDLNAAILRQDPALSSPATPTNVTANRSLLIVCSDARNLNELITLVAPLAQRPRHDLMLVLLVEQPDALAQATRLANECRSDLADAGISTRAAAFTSHEAAIDIARLVSDAEVALVVADAAGRLDEGGRFDADLAGVLAAVPCDVALLARAGASARHSAAPVLVPLAGPSTSGPPSSSVPGSRTRKGDACGSPGPRATSKPAAGMPADCSPGRRSSSSR